MSADVKIKDFSHDINKSPKHLRDVLVGSFCRLEYKAMKDYYKKKQNNNLDANVGFEKSFDEFNKAKERMKQQMISSDNSSDNRIIYTAISSFKKKKE